MEPGRPIAMGRLAETLACDASNVTGLIDRLESRGLVRRQPSSGDRRQKVLELTPAGERLRRILLERMANPPQALKQLPAVELRTLAKILRHVLEEKECPE